MAKNFGPSIGGGMPAKELKEWAQEEILSNLDEFLKMYEENGGRLGADDREALTKQRNRIAKMFHKPEIVTF
jgi:hypothetical protein